MRSVPASPGVILWRDVEQALGDPEILSVHYSDHDYFVFRRAIDGQILCYRRWNFENRTRLYWVEPGRHIQDSERHVYFTPVIIQDERRLMRKYFPEEVMMSLL